jgi:TolA-binding protein
VHIKEQPKNFARFGVQWTPTIQILDSDGTKQHQIEGFLPPEDFLAQLQLGLAHAAFSRQKWDEAECWFDDIVKSLPDSDAAAEALYWLGVSRYKEYDDATALEQTAEAFKTHYVSSPWAKKSSVWAH